MNRPKMKKTKISYWKSSLNRWNFLWQRGLDPGSECFFSWIRSLSRKNLGSRSGSGQYQTGSETLDVCIEKQGLRQIYIPAQWDTTERVRGMEMKNNAVSLCAHFTALQIQHISFQHKFKGFYILPLLILTLKMVNNILVMVQARLGIW